MTITEKLVQFLNELSDHGTVLIFDYNEERPRKFTWTHYKEAASYIISLVCDWKYDPENISQFTEMSFDKVIEKFVEDRWFYHSLYIYYKKPMSEDFIYLSIDD